MWFGGDDSTIAVIIQTFPLGLGWEMQGEDTQVAKRRQACSLLPEILPFGIPQQTGINRVLQTPEVQMACSTLSKCPIWSTLYSSQVSDFNNKSGPYKGKNQKLFYGF